MAKKKSSVQIEYRSITELEKYGGNPRYITDDDMARLKQSISDNPDYFECRPIILSDRTGTLVIIAGNQRFEAARLLGLEEVPTVLLHGLSENREREIIIRDNISNGRWDWDVLANEGWDVKDMQDWGLECDFLSDDGQNWENLETIEEEQKKPELEKPEKIEVIVPIDIKDELEEIKKAIKEAISKFDGCEIK